MATVYGSRGVSERMSREDNDTAVEMQDANYERNGTTVGATHGRNVDALFREFDYEDALKEISKLPPSERKQALRDWKRRQRGEA